MRTSRSIVYVLMSSSSRVLAQCVIIYCSCSIKKKKDFACQWSRWMLWSWLTIEQPPSGVKARLYITLILRLGFYRKSNCIDLASLICQSGYLHQTARRSSCEWSLMLIMLLFFATFSFSDICVSEISLTGAQSSSWELLFRTWFGSVWCVAAIMWSPQGTASSVQHKLQTVTYRKPIWVYYGIRTAWTSLLLENLILIVALNWYSSVQVPECLQINSL